MPNFVTKDGKLILKDGKLLVDSSGGDNSCCCCGPCVDGSITLSVCIDGSDYFILRGCDLDTVHRNWELPGKHPDCTCTAITVNGELWDPWEEPAGSNAKIFDLKKIERYFGPSSMSVTKQSGRGEVSVVEQPDINNNWTGKILIDDDGPFGPECYSVLIEWTCATTTTTSPPVIEVVTDAYLNSSDGTVSVTYSEVQEDATATEEISQVVSCVVTRDTSVGPSVYCSGSGDCYSAKLELSRQPLYGYRLTGNTRVEIENIINSSCS